MTEKPGKLKSRGIKLYYSDRLVNLPVEKIVRSEADCNYTIVHTQNEKYVSSRTLKHYEETLDKTLFIRVHTIAYCQYEIYERCAVIQ